MKALTLRRFGGPEVLEYTDVSMPPLRPGAALLRLRAIGLNFADVYRRRGDAPIAGTSPYILGYEGAGVIEAVAADVHFVRPGMRVGFADGPFANAQYAVVDQERLIPLPASIDDETAAAALLQGLTAHFLVHDSYSVRAGTRAVVHAAAGGVGVLLVQALKCLDALVLGFASDERKLDVVRAAGADVALAYDASWPQRASGADVIYDGVGATLAQSVQAVRRGGTVVFYGTSGGHPKEIDLTLLIDQSKTIVGGDLWNVLTSREERLRRSAELFDWIQQGKVRVHIARKFPLRDGAEAHRFLESRRSIGKIVLIPD